MILRDVIGLLIGLKIFIGGAIEIHLKNGIIRERLPQQHVFIPSHKTFAQQLIRFPFPAYENSSAHEELGAGCSGILDGSSKVQVAKIVSQFFKDRTAETFNQALIRSPRNLDLHLNRRSLEAVSTNTQKLEKDLKILFLDNKVNSSAAVKPNFLGEIKINPVLPHSENFISQLFDEQLDKGLNYCQGYKKPNNFSIEFEVPEVDKIILILSNKLLLQESLFLHGLMRAHLIFKDKTTGSESSVACGHNGSPRVKFYNSFYPLLVWGCGRPRIPDNTKIFLQIYFQITPSFFCQLRFTELLLRSRPEKIRNKRFLDFITNETPSELVAAISKQLNSDELTIIEDQKQLGKLESKFSFFSNKTTALFDKINLNFCLRAQRSQRASFHSFLNEVFDEFLGEILAELSLTNAKLTKGEVYAVYTNLCRIYNKNNFQKECTGFYKFKGATLDNIFYSSVVNKEGIYFRVNYQIPHFQHYITGDVYKIFPVPVPISYNKDTKKFFFEKSRKEFLR